MNESGMTGYLNFLHTIRTRKPPVLLLTARKNKCRFHPGFYRYQILISNAALVTLFHNSTG
jgi:hypothetical protein